MSMSLNLNPLKEVAMTDSVTPLAQTVMRGVAASGVVTPARLDGAVEVMRNELKELLMGERYADARDCILRGSLHQNYVLGLVIAECVARIAELPQ
jgi:hypothetical protein